MNKKQTKILWIGIIVFVLMGLFPPYEVTRIVDQAGKTIEGPIKYEFFLSPPCDISFTRLIIQWIIVSVLTAGAIYSTKETSDKNRQDVQG